MWALNSASSVHRSTSNQRLSASGSGGADGNLSPRLSGHAAAAATSAAAAAAIGPSGTATPHQQPASPRPSSASQVPAASPAPGMEREGSQSQQQQQQPQRRPSSSGAGGSAMRGPRTEQEIVYEKLPQVSRQWWHLALALLPCVRCLTSSPQVVGHSQPVGYLLLKALSTGWCVSITLRLGCTLIVAVT